MLTKNTIKIIQSLVDKKGRKENGLFVIEGEKMVNEALNSGLKILEIYGTADWFEKKELIDFNGKKEMVKESELKKISTLSTPNNVLCVVEIPKYKIDFKKITQNFVLGLDNIQDPGNLGTIIRTADWFGITDIFCSVGSVDAYNPKVVQATMGAISRARVHYVDLADLINKIKKQDKNYLIYGAFMDGKNIFEEKFKNKGMLIFGNESQGISGDIEKEVNKKITIPRAKGSQMESLNVSVAAGIILAECGN
jgi:TrmH family RNA methyltransferase